MKRYFRKITSIPHLFRDFRNHNEEPLNIKTFDGSDSPFHPTVLYFADGWNGHRYWMSESPFPLKSKLYRDRWECPCIHVSDDGLHWFEPYGLINPIDDIEADQIARLDYLSDPHIFMRENVMECWYRITDRQGSDSYGKDSSTHRLLRKTTKDGVNWSEREMLLDISAEFGRELVSQAVIWQDGRYKMWMVDLDKEKRGHYPILYMESTDALHWSHSTLCSFHEESICPWHIDVQFFDGYYWLVCYERELSKQGEEYYISNEKISLWKSANGISYQIVRTLAQAPFVLGSFYSHGFYRSCICKVADNDYRIYFSAVDKGETHIGVMKGDTPSSCKILSVDGQKHRSWLQFLFILSQEVTDKLSYYLKR